MSPIYSTLASYGRCVGKSKKIQFIFGIVFFTYFRIFIGSQQLSLLLSLKVKDTKRVETLIKVYFVPKTKYPSHNNEFVNKSFGLLAIKCLTNA